MAVLSSALKAAWRQKFILAAWILFCIGLATVYITNATSWYTATATLLLDPKRPVGMGGAEGVAVPSLDVSRAESELQVLRSERLLSNVYSSLGLAANPEFEIQISAQDSSIKGIQRYLFGLRQPTLSPETVHQIEFENFAQRLTVRRVGQSYVVEVSYTSENPTTARRVANAAVSAYLWQSIAAKADAAKNGAEFLQGRVNALTSQARSAAAAVSDGRLPDAPTPDADARVIGAALQPLKPSAPRKILILGLGATVGLVGGLLVVAVRQALDQHIYIEEDFIQRVGIPCLAVLPKMPRAINRVRRDFSNFRDTTGSWLRDEKFDSGIRDLRTAVHLNFMVRGHENNSVVALVACAPSLATQLIGLSLVKLIQESRQSAILIDTDIHGTDLANIYDDTDMNDGTCLVELLKDAGQDLSAKLIASSDVSVIPAKLSNQKVDRGIYLGSPEFRTIVGHMRRSKHVVLGLPPLSASADTLAAARQADAIVIVVEAGRSTFDQLSDAVNRLEEVGGRVIGAVLVRA